jgi:RNA polymerase sigma-70 factor (ECF subfamily)
MNAAASGSLIRQLIAGNEDAAARVVAVYAQRLLSVAKRNLDMAVARRVDPEDVVQSAFRVLFARLRLGKYQPASGDELWRLLLTITLNSARRKKRHHRAARRDARRDQPAPPDSMLYRITLWLAGAPAGPEEAAALKDELRSLFESLPERDRPLLAHRLEGLSTEEIVSKTGRSARTVRRVFEQLRRRLQRAAKASAADSCAA